MNTGTAISTYIFGFVVVILIGVAIRRMLRGWRGRAERQTELIGTLPTMPDLVGSAVIAPTCGLYVGSTLAPNWLERVAAGDLGYRSKAVLTRYPEGILLERSGASPIWIPEESLIGVRAERALAGKVIPGARTGAEAPGGILVLRWRLPSGTEIDTGFRGDDRRGYGVWTSSHDMQTPSSHDRQTPSSHDMQTPSSHDRQKGEV